MSAEFNFWTKLLADLTEEAEKIGSGSEAVLSVSRDFGGDWRLSVEVSFRHNGRFRKWVYAETRQNIEKDMDAESFREVMIHTFRRETNEVSMYGL